MDYSEFHLLHVLLHLGISYVDSQFSFTQVLPSDCLSQSLYFDFSILACGNCSDASQKVSDSGYTCSCANGYAANVETPRTLQCRSCLDSGTQYGTTPDGYYCARCSSSSTSSTCSCATGQELIISYSPVQVFSSGASLVDTSCATCSGTSITSTGSFSCYPCPDCENVCTGIASGQVYGGLCFTGNAITTWDLNNIRSDNAYINSNLAGAYGACRVDEERVKNQTACQHLANMCVMEMYSSQAESCVQYELANSDQFGITNVNQWRSRLLPWLYYQTSLNEEILLDESIGSVSTFTTDGYLNLIVAQYRANGTFLGYSSVLNGLLQICKDSNIVSNAAYEFGTTYSSQCTQDVGNLTSSDAADTYYSMYLQTTSSTGQTLLHPVPVLVSNYESNFGGLVNQEDTSSTWQLVTRFFLVDTLSQADSSQIQYAQSMQIQITLNPSLTGAIYPPLLRITYATASSSVGTNVQSIFAVSYASSTSDQEEGIMISMSILGVFAVLYAAVEASGWRRRQGLPYVELTAIIHFILSTLTNVANIFFVIMLGYTTILMLYFKGAIDAVLYIPSNTSYQEYLFFVFIATAFTCKAVHIVILTFQQSFVDIFFIDWERPSGKFGSNKSDKVSIWRTYFLANEWNEIQTCRKINTTFQLFAVLFFLEVLNFKNYALLTIESNLNPSSTEYQPEYSILMRFAIGGLVYVLVDLIQVIYYKLIHERFISDPMRDFIDLCSVSNVSVFILSQNAFGYYIHGRSVHGRADTDMAEMALMMKREERDAVPKRGLETGSEVQVFEMLITPKMRQHYDKIYEPLRQARLQPHSRGPGLSDESSVAENLKAYGTMKTFLTSFIDHSLKDVDYIIKEKLLMERIIGIDFQDATEKVFFTIGDDDAFADILFYGHEVALLIFDVLLFSLVDIGSQSFVVAAFVTYIVSGVLRILRNQLARHNLAKKTLIDKRFLI